MRYILVIMFLVCANLFSQYATNDAYTPPQNNNNNNTAATEEESYITNDAVVGRKPAVINIPITGFKNIK